MSNPQESIEKVRDLVKGIKVAMFTTEDIDGDFHSRPMMTQEADFDGDIWFFAFRDSPKVEEIEHNPSVNVAYMGDNSFVSIAGRVEVVNDVQKKKELWHEPLRIWFEDGPESPDVVLLRIRSQSAQYWEGPSGVIGKAVSMVKVLLTGDPEAAGENKKVRLSR